MVVRSLFRLPICLLLLGALAMAACASPGSSDSAAPESAASTAPQGDAVTTSSAPSEGQGDGQAASQSKADAGPEKDAAKATEVPPVLFEPPHGNYDAPLSVTLRPAKPDTRMIFTTDGSLPGLEHGTPYSGPIAVTTTTVIRVAYIESADADAANGPATGKAEDKPDGQKDKDAAETPADPSKAKDDQPADPTETPSPIAATLSQTYVFARDVVYQPARPAGWPATWGPVPADYAMDPRSAATAADADAVAESLAALPSVSLVMEPADLVDGKVGIYANPLGRGKDWERAASVELWGRGEAGFRANLGTRMHGGHGREPDKTAKHSFRLLFRKEYGQGSLKYPLFEGDGVDKFDALVLRAPYNDGWPVGSGSQRERALLMRDEWLRRTQLAAGGRAPRGRFVHLYLNGLYWGIYNLTERIDADFTAAYWDGDKDEWDVNNSGDFTDGNDEAWFELVRAFEASPFDDAAYQRAAAMLDLDNVIDYLIIEFYSGNADWPDHNWTAARRRAGGERWRFLVWDGERGLEYEDRNNVVDLAGSPGGFFFRMKDNPDFRRRFAARWAILFGEGGALHAASPASPFDPAHPEANAPVARFMALTDAVEPGVLAEAARWGDYRTGMDDQPFGYVNSWVPERARVLAEFFPKRVAVLEQQLKALGLELGRP